MVLTSKWGIIKPEIQIRPDQVVAASWTLVGSPKHAEKMLIQLRSDPRGPQCIAAPHLYLCHDTSPDSAVHNMYFDRQYKVVCNLP